MGQRLNHGRVRQVARIHGFRKRQVLSNEEPDHLALGLRHGDSLHGRIAKAQRNVHVPLVGRPLADIVIEQREVQRRRILELRQQLGEGRDRRVLRLTKLEQSPDGHEGVLVHRVAVKEIPDDQAVDILLLGKHGLERAGFDAWR